VQFLKPILLLGDEPRGLYQTFILKPLMLGYGVGRARVDSLLRGGNYYPAAKPGKPGLRPIIIGHLDRRICSSLFVQYHRTALTSFFTQSHPRVIQHAGGLEDGAIRFAKLIQSAMGPQVPVPYIPSEAFDPMVVIGLDCKNAFNSLGALGDGYVLRPGDSISHCASFAAHILPYASQFLYQGDCRLFLKQQPRVEAFPCSMGVHQGDPAGLSLFCHALHPFLLRIADKHGSCLFPLYADNITVVGRFSEASAAVKDIVDTLRDDLSLEIQPRDSKIFSASWIGLPPDQQDAIRGFLWARFPHLRSFAIEQEGIVLGGIPVGSTSFIQAWLSAKLTSLDEELRLLGDLPTLQYFLRGIDPFLVLEACSAFDTSVVRELGNAFQWPPHVVRVPGGTLSPMEFASLKRQLPYAEGGDGFTPQAGVALSAYYMAAANFLQWSASLSWMRDSNQLYSRESGLLWDSDAPDQPLNPMLRTFLQTSQELIARGVPHYSDLGELDRAKESNAIPLPTFFRIGGGPPFLPPHRAVTAHLMKTFPPHLERKAHLYPAAGGPADQRQVSPWLASG